MLRILFTLVLVASTLKIGMVVAGDRVAPANGAEKIASEDNVIEAFDVEGNGDTLLIPVTIGDHQYPFIVDTGSSLTIFDSSLKAALLPTGKQMKINGEGMFDLYKCAGAVVGAAKLPVNKPAFCLDLGAIRKSSCLDIRGILGMDFLRQYVLQIDFDAGRLRLLKSSDGAPGIERPIIMGPSDCPKVMVKLPLFGLGRTEFKIDTGESGIGSGSLRPEFFDCLLDRHRIKGVNRVPITTFDGLQNYRCGFVEAIAIGDLQHKQQNFREGRSNSLALGYLSRYKVTFDFSRKRAFFAKGLQFERPYPFNQSGVYLEMLDGNLIVDGVDEGGLGFSCGLRKNDQLLRIGDNDFRNMKLHTARLVMREAIDGLRLTVVSEGEENPHEVVIRRSRDDGPLVK